MRTNKTYFTDYTPTQLQIEFGEVKPVNPERPRNAFGLPYFSEERGKVEAVNIDRVRWAYRKMIPYFMGYNMPDSYHIELKVGKLGKHVLGCTHCNFDYSMKPEDRYVVIEVNTEFYFDDFGLLSVMVHELCHVAHRVNAKQRDKSHGSEWKAVAAKLQSLTNIKIARCDQYEGHNYNYGAAKRNAAKLKKQKEQLEYFQSDRAEFYFTVQYGPRLGHVKIIPTTKDPIFARENPYYEHLTYRVVGKFPDWIIRCKKQTRSYKEFWYADNYAMVHFGSDYNNRNELSSSELKEIFRSTLNDWLRRYNINVYQLELVKSSL